MNNSSNTGQRWKQREDDMTTVKKHDGISCSFKSIFRNVNTYISHLLQIKNEKEEIKTLYKELVHW